MATAVKDVVQALRPGSPRCQNMPPLAESQPVARKSVTAFARVRYVSLEVVERP